MPALKEKRYDSSYNKLHNILHESAAMVVGGVAIRVSTRALSMGGSISLKHSTAEQLFGAETLQEVTDGRANGEHLLVVHTFPPVSYTLPVQLRVLQRTAPPSNSPDGSTPPPPSLHCELCGLGSWLRGQGAVPGVHWVQLWRGARGALRLRLCDGKPTALPGEGATAQQHWQLKLADQGCHAFLGAATQIPSDVQRGPSGIAGMPSPLGSVPEPEVSPAVRAAMRLTGSAAQAVADAAVPWELCARAALVRVAVGAAAGLLQREAEQDAVGAAAAAPVCAAAGPQPCDMLTHMHSPEDALSLLRAYPPAVGQGSGSVSSGPPASEGWPAKALPSPTPAQPHAGHGSDSCSTGCSLSLSSAMPPQPPPRPPQPMLPTARPRPLPPLPPRPPQPPPAQAPTASGPAWAHDTAELQAFHRAVSADQVVTVDVCQIGRSQAARLGAEALKVWPEAWELHVREARVVLVHLVQRVPVRHGAAVYHTAAHTVAAKLLRWGTDKFALAGLGQAGDTFSLGRDPSGKVWAAQLLPRPQPQMPSQPSPLPPTPPPPPPPMYCQQQLGGIVQAEEDHVQQPRPPCELPATRQGAHDPQEQQQQRPEGRCQRPSAQQVQLPGKHLHDISRAPAHVQGLPTPQPPHLPPHLPPPSLPPPSCSLLPPPPPPPPLPPPLLPQFPPPPPPPPQHPLSPSLPPPSPPPLLLSQHPPPPEEQQPSSREPPPLPAQQPLPPAPLHQPLLLQQTQLQQQQELGILSLRATINKGRINMQTTGASTFWGEELFQGPEGSAFVQLHVMPGAAAAGNPQGTDGLQQDMQEEQRPPTAHAVRVTCARKSAAHFRWYFSSVAAVVRDLGAADKDQVLLTRLPDGRVAIQRVDAGQQQQQQQHPQQHEQREEPGFLSLRGTVHQCSIGLHTTGASAFWGRELFPGPEGSAFVQLHVLPEAAAACSNLGANGPQQEIQGEQLPSAVHTVRVICARKSAAHFRWFISGGAPAVIRALGAVDRDRVLLTRLPDGRVAIQRVDGGEQGAGDAAGQIAPKQVGTQAQAQQPGDGPQRAPMQPIRGEVPAAVGVHQQQQRPELHGGMQIPPAQQVQLSDTHLQQSSQAPPHMQAPDAEVSLQGEVQAASAQAQGHGQGHGQGRHHQPPRQEREQQADVGHHRDGAPGGQQALEVVGPPGDEDSTERAAKRARLSEPQLDTTADDAQRHVEQQQQLAGPAEPSGACPANRVFAGFVSRSRVQLRIGAVSALWPEAAARMQHGQSQEVLVHVAPAAGQPGEEGAGEQQQQEQLRCFRLLLKVGVYLGRGRAWRLGGCEPLFRALGASVGDAIYMWRSPEDGRMLAQAERSPPPAPQQSQQQEHGGSQHQLLQDKEAPPQQAQQRPNRQRGSRQRQHGQQLQQRQRQEDEQQDQLPARHATPPCAGPADRVFVGYKHRGRMDVKPAAVAELWPSALELRYGQETEVTVHAAAGLETGAAAAAAELLGDGKAGEQREDELAPFQVLLKLRLGPNNTPAWRMSGCLGLVRALGAADGDAIYMWRLPGDGRIVAGMERRGRYGGRVAGDVLPAQQQQKRKATTAQQQGKGGAERDDGEWQETPDREDMDLDGHDSDSGEDEGHGRGKGWGFEAAGAVQRGGRAGAMETESGAGGGDGGDSAGGAGEEEAEGEGEEEEDLGGNCWLRAVAAEASLWEEGGWLGDEGGEGEEEEGEEEEEGMH